MNREKVKRKKTTKMPMVERATTTTANGLSRRHRIILPPIRKSKEIDVDYLQALKVFFLTYFLKVFDSVEIELSKYECVLTFKIQIE
jgi:hypothetical protein